MAEQEHTEGNGNKVGVAYTVKELLASLNDKIDRIEAKLDNKVDRTELDSLMSKLLVLETKQATAEALKIQTDQIGQIYLKQWEQALADIADLKTSRAATVAIQKDKDNWKILWVPVGVNSVGIAVLLLGFIWQNFIK